LSDEIIMCFYIWFIKQKSGTKNTTTLSRRSLRLATQAKG